MYDVAVFQCSMVGSAQTTQPIQNAEMLLAGHEQAEKDRYVIRVFSVEDSACADFAAQYAHYYVQLSAEDSFVGKWKSRLSLWWRNCTCLSSIWGTNSRCYV